MFNEADENQETRDAVRHLCSARSSLMRLWKLAGWLAARVPEECGGTRLGLTAVTVIIEWINRCGGNAGAVHGQMYNMGTLLRYGGLAQKKKFLPPIAR